MERRGEERRGEERRGEEGRQSGGRASEGHGIERRAARPGGVGAGKKMGEERRGEALQQLCWAEGHPLPTKQAGGQGAGSRGACSPVVDVGDVRVVGVDGAAQPKVLHARGQGFRVLGF